MTDGAGVRTGKTVRCCRPPPPPTATTPVEDDDDDTVGLRDKKRPRLPTIRKAAVMMILLIYLFFNRSIFSCVSGQQLRKKEIEKTK